MRLRLQPKDGSATVSTVEVRRAAAAAAGASRAIQSSVRRNDDCGERVGTVIAALEGIDRIQDPSPATVGQFENNPATDGTCAGNLTPVRCGAVKITGGVLRQAGKWTASVGIAGEGVQNGVGLGLRRSGEQEKKARCH